MKILLDHCVPRPFLREFPAHDVKTTAQMGWQDLRNGILLAEAAQVFDVLLTVDKNLKHEQNLSSLPLPVIVLDAVKNTPDALRPFAPFVEMALLTLRIGQLIEIDVNGNVGVIAPGR
jgi:predicted nuclease of predicted toxin-antitoxin system